MAAVFTVIPEEYVPPLPAASFTCAINLPDASTIDNQPV
jgi:hypothetical protein